MTSYQRRLRDIAYLRQCVKELEDIAIDMARTLDQNFLTLPSLSDFSSGLIGKGIEGDEFLTPYNNGEFFRRLNSDDLWPRKENGEIDHENL